MHKDLKMEIFEVNYELIKARQDLALVFLTLKKLATIEEFELSPEVVARFREQLGGRALSEEEIRRFRNGHLTIEKITDTLGDILTGSSSDEEMAHRLKHFRATMENPTLRPVAVAAG